MWVLRSFALSPLAGASVREAHSHCEQASTAVREAHCAQATVARLVTFESLKWQAQKFIFFGGSKLLLPSSRPGSKTDFVVAKLYVHFYAAVVLGCVDDRITNITQNALN